MSGRIAAGRDPPLQEHNDYDDGTLSNLDRERIRVAREVLKTSHDHHDHEAEVKAKKKQDAPGPILTAMFVWGVLVGTAVILLWQQLQSFFGGLIGG